MALDTVPAVAKRRSQTPLEMPISFDHSQDVSATEASIPSMLANSHPLGLGSIQDSLSSAPKIDPIYLLLQLSLAFNQLNEEEADLLDLQTLYHQEQHKALAKKQKALIEEKTAKTTALNNWQIAGSIVSYGANAASLAAGIGFCASPVGAAALIASGTIGIASKVMSDTGAWKWVASQITSNPADQQKYASYLETITNVASIGVSLFSGFAASKALDVTAKLWQTAFSTTVGVSSAVTSVGGEFTKSSVLDTEAKLTAIGAEKKDLFHHLTLAHNHMTDIAAFNKATLPALGRMVEEHLLYV